MSVLESGKRDSNRFHFIAYLREASGRGMAGGASRGSFFASVERVLAYGPL